MAKYRKNRSRVYEDSPEFLGIDMGKIAYGSWIKLDRSTGHLHIESCCAEGPVILSTEHARLLASRLRSWSLPPRSRKAKPHALK